VISKAKPMTGLRVLIIDDHRNIRLSLRMILESEGALVTESEHLASARGHLKLDQLPAQNLPFDLVLLDIRLPDGSGLDLLKQMAALNVASQVIVISGEGTMQEAFNATQMGAFDFVEKPFTPERILVSSQRCIDFNQLERRNAALVKQSKSNEILGEHVKIKEMLAMIAKVGPTNGRVLITGESGTGKELIARGLHRASLRSAKPMIKVNCAAIPKNLMESELFGHEKGSFTGALKTRIGVFERSDGGTLFLDEIGELDLDVQAKLLRVLQNGDFTRVGGEKALSTDVRIICATNRDLKQMSAAGKFREDLFYRLNVITINSIPLRDHPSDISLLSREFLNECNEEHSLGGKVFSDRALSQLNAYSWPGNVRELQNIIERTAILSSDSIIERIEGLESADAVGGHNSFTLEAENATIDGDRLKFDLGIGSWENFHDHVGREFVKFILKQTNGNVSEAARILDLERAYLHRLMKKLGLHRDVSVQ
jgi:two-component system, NtrC family, nitrogen regulation response regulator NtrX